MSGKINHFPAKSFAERVHKTSQKISQKLNNEEKEYWGTVKN
jgi:hypothetical protein